MGNSKSKRNNQEVENFINEFFINTGLEFTNKEITNFKLCIADTEKYFCTKFDYFIFFNNYVFRERLSILYDNYNSKIETVASKGSLSVLINFDETEIGYLLPDNKPDFDSLFTIILEKLEMGQLLFFNMTNLHYDYVIEFLTQMIDSIDMYRYNRKYDCLYFFLPNMDFFIKNENGIFYISGKKTEMFSLKDNFSSRIFSINLFNNLIESVYPKMDVNNFFNNFIENYQPVLIKTMINFNFTECEQLEYNNQEQINDLISLFGKTNFLHLIVDVGNITNVEIFNKIIYNFIIKIISIHEFSENTNFKLTIISKDKVTYGYNLKNILESLHNYFSLKIFTIKKYNMIIEFLNILKEDQLNYNLSQEELVIYWGGNNQTFYSLYYTISKKTPKLWKLNKQPIIINLSKFINLNYKIFYKKNKFIMKREDYINRIYN